jgi:hypothetical protein
MTTLDDFFRVSAPVPPHPRLRHWKERLSQTDVKAELELYQPPTLLGVEPTDMNLRFIENGKPEQLETVAWDDDLNTGLIQLGVRAINSEQEAQRFALGLHAALRKAGREFGDGYLNSALLDFLKDSDLSHYPEIAEVLKYTFGNAPKREGKAEKKYQLCREMITDAFSGRAQELTGPLKYPQDEAKQILVAALARYLDERFSVSHRRRLGLL